MSEPPAPENSEERTTCTAELNCVRLNRRQLDALINRCSEGLVDPVVRVSTAHNGEPLSATTLADLILKVEQLDGEVASLANLRIESHSGADTVEIAFSYHLALITVSSNATWAHGRTEVLRKFLRGRNARDWRPKVESAKTMTAISACVTTVIIVAWLAMTGRATIGSTVVVSALLALAVLTLIGAHRRARRRVELVLANALPARRLLPTWIIDAVPFGSSVIGLTAALVKAFS